MNIYYKGLLVLGLVLMSPMSHSKSNQCFKGHNMKQLTPAAQAYVEAIKFDVAVMQKRVGIEELLGKVSTVQADFYQSGESNELAFGVSKAFANNSIMFYQEASPEYFIPFSATLTTPTKTNTELSVKKLEQALSLSKCEKSGRWVLEVNQNKWSYFFDYVIPAQKISEPTVLITIGVNDPFVSEDRPASTGTIDGILYVDIDSIGYAGREKVPTLHSKEPATREGLWMASVPKSHPYADKINRSSGVFLRVGEIIPAFGSDDKDEKFVKWQWVNNGVEFLKAKAAKEKKQKQKQ